MAQSTFSPRVEKLLVNFTSHVTSHTSRATRHVVNLVCPCKGSRLGDCSTVVPSEARFVRVAVVGHVQDSDPVHNQGTRRAIQHAIVGESLDVALSVDVFLRRFSPVSACFTVQRELLYGV